MNIINELKYQWFQFKQQVRGGYEIFKEILNIQTLKEQFKENMKNYKEDDEYEKEQKRINRKTILKENDIIEFCQPERSFNVIKCKIIDITSYRKSLVVMRSNLYESGVVVRIKILESGFPKEIGQEKYVYQKDILNNIIK